MTARPRVLLALLCVFTGTAQAQSTATLADFDALVGYFTAGSATWLQDNAEPGDDGPTHWVRRHEIVGDVATVRVVAAHADGRCVPVTTIEYHWSEGDRTITTRSRTATGLSFQGRVEPLGDDRYRTVTEGALPDGAQLRMRDTSDLSTPDVAVTAAERWTEDGWVALDGARWRRVAAEAWCGEES